MSHTVAVSARTTAQVLLGAVVGAASWTFTEYGMHRWVLHGPFGSGKLRRIALGGLHRAHHRDPTATSLPARSAGHLAMAATGTVVGALGATLMPALVARTAGAMWAAGYSTYEVVHWNAHHRKARTAWGQRVRDRHHHHHYGAPKHNLGVTLSVWDGVFGTEADG